MKSLGTLCFVVLCVAQLTAGTICPSVTPNPGITDPSGCNSIITYTNSGWSIVTVDSHPYESTEDQLVGVVNNSTSTTVTSIPLSGTNIFGFDRDGICSSGFIPSSYCTSQDSSGYGPNGVSFSITNANSGSVMFGPGIAPGGTAFFSLEEGPTTGGIIVGSGVPEPGTLGMLGLGFVAVGAFGRKQFRRSA